MANEIYDSTWWGNTIDTASSIGTSTEMIQGQINMNKLGDDLVVNGDFSKGTNGWSSGNSTLSVVDGKLKVLATAPFSYARQNVTVVSGVQYKITANFYHNSLVGNIEAYDGTTNIISEQLSEDGLITLYVNTNSTNLRLTLLNRNGVSGDFNYWDNVSIQQVRATTVEASKCLADTIHRIGLQDIQN